MKQLLFVGAAILSIMACNDAKPEKDLSIVPLNAVATGDNVANNTVTNETAIIQQTAMPQIETASPIANGLNPAHGMPGHLCEIEVGAPLSSAPAKVGTAATAKTNGAVPQPITFPATSTAKTVTSKGMNPPHGETGHRCDITVGAPLNPASTNPAKSVENKSSENIIPVISPTQNIPLVPALQNTTMPTPQIGKVLQEN